ncbi:MAG: putative heme-binding domain-containing protein [Rhodothermales bacterium]|jgi:putative heme-binding domain-containing protein
MGLMKHLLFLFAVIVAARASAEVAGITLRDDRYDVSMIDSDETEFFVSHAMDLSGRLFVGCRETLFAYEPEGAGFAERQELFRFPTHSWLYDLEVYGDDLFVLCNTALYRIRGAVTKREGLKPEKLLWGLPQGHFHQGMHGLEFGPTGDLFISMGDPQPHMHWDRARPDHLWHWTFFVGPENREVPYTGVGAVLRYGLKDHSLTVHASGLRNSCAISFDPQWRLYANDNDQEGASASPGKLVYAPRHSWHGWVRGWAARQHPTRRDILPVTNLELDVPVGQCWHDGAVLVANWGNRTVSRHRVTDHVAPRDVFLEGEGLRRPVTVMPLNDGRLVVSVCYMQGNEGSPVRQTDLLLLTPQTPSEPWALRYRKHQEILRKGGDELAQAGKRFLRSPHFEAVDSSLIYLAAVHGDAQSLARIQALAAEGEELAIRAMAEFPAKFATLDVGPLLAQPKLRHAVLEYLHAVGDLPPVEFAADQDAFVRQSAAVLLARRASVEQLTAWATDDSATIRQAAVNAAGFYIWETIESTTDFPTHREAARSSQIAFEHPDGLVTLEKPVFIFMPSEWWKENRESVAAHAAILTKALADPSPEVRVPAAVQLFFLKDPTVDERALAILGEARIDLGAKSKASQNARAEKMALRALKSATLASGETIPAAFANQNWRSGGDAAVGKNLFTSRGCIACHLAPDDGKGGSIGPSLVDVHTRFSAQYLAESILLPNRFVSPNFHPTTLTMKDGAVHTGFIEKDADVLDLRIVTGTVTKLPAAEIAKRETSHQSMMPAGLVQSPDEMRHLLAYMLKRDALSTWQTTGNWMVDGDGALVLTPRPGEKDWTRYGDYLWSKKPYQNFECEFEYKHEKGGNSGFYFNVTDRQKAAGSVIEVQIIDSHGKSKLDAHGVCGGILPGVDPKANAAKPAGEWNHMMVKSQDGEVTVTLNGVLVNQVSLTHANLSSKPKQGYFGFQDHGLPFWLRNIKLRGVPSSGAAPAAPAGRGFHPGKPNVYEFGPLKAQFVRVELLGDGRGQPCIDEFEILGPGSQTNLALAGKASASSLLPGYEWKHQIGFLNDGKYGNPRSWIPAKETGWAQIKLAKSADIDRVVLSRDREGKLRDRSPVNFDIQVSSDDKTWKIVKKVRAGKAIPTGLELAEQKMGGASRSPNVILIFTDDMGYSDLPKFGKSEIPTPAIDRLAKEGTLFTGAYVTAPICVASRMGLLTGQNQQRFGVYDNIYGAERVRLFLDQTLLPAVFQDAGYRTAHVGKWHLAGNGRQQYEGARPRDRGFDESVGIRGGHADFWKGTPVFRNGKEFPAPEYLTDFWGTEACAFIDRAHAKPFFLYLAYNAVHSPMHALEADRSKFPEVEDENRRTYDGMLLAMDRSIGRVLDRLDTHGIADNTVVVFLNDNGGGGSTSLYAGHSRNYANNKPLSGHKFDVLEGGVRVPMIIRWPKQVPAGKVYGDMVSSTDVFPTVVKAAGLQMPKGQAADGVDLLPFITGKMQSKPHDWLCWQNRAWLPRKKGSHVVPTPKVHNSAIRKGNWKLVRYGEKIGSVVPPPAWRLYDLKKDIGEQNDVAKQHTEVVKELSAHFDHWRSSMHPTVE